MFDVLIKNALFFDGTGVPGVVRHLGIRDGKLACISASVLDENGCGQVIDAQNRWVTPGFIDMHTHYDAELVAAPALKESVRHGVTTVMIGSCSISMVLSSPEDCSDLFTRVESVPREHVLPLLQARKTWHSADQFAVFLDQHPLGPNICSFLGHSDLRVAVLGLERAVDANVRPTEGELQQMERLLEEALDAGLLGLSSMTNPWDKLDGDRQRSKSLPSVYAPWAEYARLNKILRRRGRIHQGAPNLVTKLNVLAFLWDSIGGWWRKPLKTTLITLMDVKADPWLAPVLGPLTRWINRLTHADFRWQTLPVPFETYADGMEFVVFEEFPAGQPPCTWPTTTCAVNCSKTRPTACAFARTWRRNSAHGSGTATSTTSGLSTARTPAWSAKALANWPRRVMNTRPICFSTCWWPMAHACVGAP